MLSKNAIIIIAIVLVVALLATGLVLWFTLGGEDEPEEPNTPPNHQGGIIFDPNQGEYDPDRPGYNGGAQQGIATQGFETWTIPPNVTKVLTDFYNPEANKDKYNMTFEVWIPKDVDDLSKGYEVIYKSGLVKPGNHIYEVTLSKAFSKGTYDAILHIQPYSADEYQTPYNNVNIKFKLIVI